MIATRTRADAFAIGARQYYTGRPCKYGHIAPRWTTNGTCVTCGAEQKTEWRATHRDQQRETDAAWREKNCDRLKSQAHARYHENPERYRGKARRFYQAHKIILRQKAVAYHHANKEERRASYARWYQANREKIAERRQTMWANNVNSVRERQRAYAANNRALYVAASHRRRARAGCTSRNLVAFLSWMRIAPRVRCYWCKQTVAKTNREADHIIPLVLGGAHAIGNLCVSCRSCNRRKNAKQPQDFSGQAELNFPV